MTNCIRLATFDEWPPGLSQRPQEMAEAGLIYLGQEKIKSIHRKTETNIKVVMK